MNEELANTVGRAARVARSRLGLTQADVAERVGIAMDVYSRMERGRVLPSVTTLRRMCQVLGLDANVLLGLREAVPEVGVAPAVEPRAEDPPSLRRLVRTLRALEPEELRSVKRVVQGALGLLRR
ncbi:helix-turn-helix transcriptional regulator [Myxococcus landrumensis]|uniref:Helix-turn-helix transcriptional regulator n=1 Tax=Myxococcus landrumensis TaxID=2813577 RepID=A0ABX7N029_9BACT|nr:helix-turn-helix transcriptional regulator [Myxococcus landrumus]QSQ12057.1 helix-turn-helix transcriptional regulator [Myxococcus landrumus]